MKVLSLHRWDFAPKEAVEIQRRLSGRVSRKWDGGPIRRVAGVDSSIAGGQIRAAVVVLSFPELELVETIVVQRRVEFPYVPGLLAFREIPALAEAFENVRGGPDAVIVDGHGVAHPRRFGIASHLGVLLDLPTVGCAKSRLCGEHAEPAKKRGSTAPLTHQGETVGSVVRTRDGVNPIFVSIGHRIDLKSAVELVMKCALRYRLPEPTRIADQRANISKGAVTHGTV